MSIYNNKKFKFSTLGNAKIKGAKNRVRAENLREAGIDGMSIDISKVDGHEFDLKNVFLKNETAINISYFGLDFLGRMKCLSQQSIYYMPEKDRIAVAFNSKLLPDRFTLVGKLKGKTVFRSEYITPRNDLKINWIWILTLAAKAIKYVLDNMSYERVHTRNSDGFSSTQTTYNWGMSYNGNDEGEGEGITYETFEGTKFNADKLYFEYTDESEKCTPVPRPKQIQITTQNIEEFELKA